MAMTKLICVRLDRDLITLIDNVASRDRGTTRSFVMAKLLQTVLTCSSVGTIDKMLSTWSSFDAGYTVHFEKDNKQL